MTRPTPSPTSSRHLGVRAGVGGPRRRAVRVAASRAGVGILGLLGEQAGCRRAQIAKERESFSFHW